MSKIKLCFLFLIVCLQTSLLLSAAVTERSLLIVIDKTGSMGEEIAQVKVAAKKITQDLASQEKNHITHFVLVAFDDPDIDPTFTTASSSQFLAALDRITLGHGGDCPEMAMTGLYNALSVAKQKSYAFLFTDADAKDSHKYSTVLNLMQSKEITLNVFVTGDCGSKTTPGFAIYYDLAKYGRGKVFEVTEKSIGNTVAAFIPELHVDYDNLLSVVKDKPETRTFYIDDTVKKIEIKVTGKNPKVELFNPFNKPVTMNLIINEPNAVVGEVPNPVIGKWTVRASADSPYSINIGAESKLDFEVEIAKSTAKNPDGTPADGSEIIVTKPDHVATIVGVGVVEENPDKSSAGRTYPVSPFANSTDKVTTGIVDIPDSTYDVSVIAKDKNGTIIEKPSYSEVKPSKPFDNDIIDVVEGTSVQLSCADSSSPTVWTFKGNVLTDSGSKSNQLTLSNAEKSSSGIYNCKSNSDNKNIKVKVVDAPKIDPQCNVETLEVGDKCALMCFYQSSKSTGVTWLDDKDKVLHKDDQTYTIQVTKETLDQKIRCKVKTVDFESTTPEFTLRTFNEHDEIKLFEVVEEMNLMLNCEVPSIKPTSMVTWSRDKMIISGPKTDTKLEFDEIKKSQSGTYSCRVVTGSEVVKKSYVVTVVSQPKIEVSTKLDNVNHVLDATLKCSYESSKTANVEWMDDDLNVLQNGGDEYKIKLPKSSADKTIYCMVKTPDFNNPASTIIAYPHV